MTQTTHRTPVEHPEDQAPAAKKPFVAPVLEKTSLAVTENSMTFVSNMDGNGFYS